ncbi:hypothetical protein [Flavobacterium branchiophilum]|uniref:Lipoprotein n=1 Tax=Flavobacterium branchiophilum TaxID=55197 RepID=A0A2H3KLP1_9FLAO|nr:hypothetical protein [Flavobacterium branchiophilum]PDS24137.1 hypothetical protein B0A77_09105 [Flavobacterium branchiophilum]
MKNSILLMLISISILSSCRKEAKQPKVTYEPKKEVQPPAKVTMKSMAIADLPIQFYGTKVLIYPIGDMNFTDRGNAEDNSFRISNNMENEITGFMQNLMFQKSEKDSLVALTNKNILLQSVTFLKNISDKTKKQILVYTLADADSNNDNQLDANDIKALYISQIDGSSFVKLSADNQELIDWNLIESQNRIYFRTIDDTNKNGKFDANDQLHYQYVNILDVNWKATTYSVF